MPISYTQNWDSTITGWTLDTPIVTTANGYSSPNSLDEVGGSASTKYFATYNSLDGASGNVEIRTKVKFTASTSLAGSWFLGPAARGSATPLNNTNTSYYWAGLKYSPKFSDFTFAVYKTVNGVTTTVGSGLTLSDEIDNEWYEIVFRLNGSSTVQLTGYVKRLTDNYFLNSSGLFVSTEQPALSVSDSSSPLSGEGYYGLLYQSSNGGSIRTDDFRVDAYSIIVESGIGFTAVPTVEREKLGSVADSLGLSASSSEVIDAAESAVATVTFTPSPLVPANDFTATVAVPINLASVVAGPADHPASVSVPINLAATSSGPRDVPSSAAAYVTLTPSDSSVADKLGSASETVTLSASTLGGTSAQYPVSSVASIGLSAWASSTKETSSSVVDTFHLLDTPDPYASPLNASVSDMLSIGVDIDVSATRIASASAVATVVLSPATSELVQSEYTRYAASAISLSASTSTSAVIIRSADASDSFVISDSSSESASLLLNVVASTAINIDPRLAQSATRTLYSTSVDTLSISSTDSLDKEVNASASDTISLSDLPVETSQMERIASDSVGIAPFVVAGRDILASVVESLDLSGPSVPPDEFFPKSAEDAISITASPSHVVGPTRDLTLVEIGLVTNVSASVVMPNGVGIVGGDPSTGLSVPVLSGIDIEWPLSFAETPEGDVIMANGVDRMAIWRALPANASFIGLTPPATAPMLGGTGPGLITGRRAAFVRFIDRDGNPSALSPASNVVDFGWERPIDDVSVSSDGKATVTAYDHNLVTGDAVVIRDVAGLPAANGTVAITRLDSDRFEIDGVYVTGEWQGGGSIVYGIQTVVYSAVPTTSDSNIVRRQILRTLDGSADSLYVDVDTADLASTSFTSTRLDESLRQQESVPLMDEKGGVWSDRFLPPPDNKPLLAVYAGRCWAGGEVSYSTGCIFKPVPGLTVQGVGTRWKSTFVGRMLYIAGARQAYPIASVDESTQVITLASPIQDTNLSRFSTYVIRSAPLDRRLIYFSDPGDFRSWPAANALAVPDDGDDEVVGLARLGQALVVVERRHIYRIVSRGEPQSDASLFLMAYRGAVNGRCVVSVDGYLYMLDEAGIHRYDGSEECEDISYEIQTMFHADGIGFCPQIDWESSNQRLWHASHDPTVTTIRWFVDLIGKESLQYALCYNYRLKSWWIEHYPFRVTSSGTADLGHRRSVAGCDLRRVFALGESATDVVDSGAGTIRGTATGGGSSSVTDSAASFPSALAGCPVSIVDGPGRGQWGIIVSNTATSIEVRDEWATPAAEGSVYQIGGVRWEWLSGWLDVTDSEQDTERDVVITYEPQNTETFCDMQIYYDHQSNPENWGIDWNADGVTVERGNPWIMFDLHFDQVAPGYRVMRLKSHHDPYAYGDRYVQILLSGVQNASVIRVYQVQMSGVEYSPEANQ